MSNIKDFKKWQVLTEQNLDVDPSMSKKEKRKARKAKRKSNKRSNRKDTYVSDEGIEYALIRKKDDDETKDSFVLKTKNSKSKIWNDEGKIVADVDKFLKDELFTGKDGGKYDEESIEMDKYKQGNRKDKVNFTVNLIDKEAKKKEEEEAKKKEEEIATETKKKKEAEDAIKHKPITVKGNIKVGDSDGALLEIKKLLPTFKKVVPSLEWKDTGSNTLTKDDLGWLLKIRAGFASSYDMNAKSPLISQTLVNAMVETANELDKAPVAKDDSKEEEKEEVASNESLLFSFEGFSMILEQGKFDAAAAESASSVSDTPSDKKKKVSKKSSGGSSSTGLTDAQAKAYRTWANMGRDVDKYGKTSKFDLDKTGTNNSYVKRSYAQAKKDRDEETGIFSGGWGSVARATFDTMLKNKASKADVTSTKKLGEGEYYMGYMQDKYGIQWAVHFASPRPSIGTIVKGDYITTKNAWTTDENKKFKVKDVWKDDNGKLGAIYIDVPKLSLPIDDSRSNKDYENKGIIVKAKGAAYTTATGNVVTIKGDYVNVRTSAMANTGGKNNLLKKVTGKGSEIGKIISTKMVTDPKGRIKPHNWYNIELKPGRTWSTVDYNGKPITTAWVRDDTVNKK